MRRSYSDAQLESALRAAGGIQTAAAETLAALIGKPVSRQAINNRVKRNPRLQQAIREAEEAVLDTAEGVLQRAIEAGDLLAVKFYLETRGKQRGYTRRIDATMTANVNVDISVSDARRAFYEELDQMAARRRQILGGRTGGDEPSGTGPASEEETRH